MSKPNGLNAPGRELARMFDRLSRHHHIVQVFRDWVEMAALSVANAVDRSQFPEREKRYLSVVNKYQKPERMMFPEMLGHLVMELDRTDKDVFGPLLIHLDQAPGNKGLGQHFTPWEVSYAMARMMLGQKVAIEAAVATKGYISVLEPACGAGGMVVAVARAMEDEGVNFQKCLHVAAVDVDSMCVHMTFLQTSLLGIPAIVYRGDSLRNKMDEHWLTPMHIKDHWSQRLNGGKFPPKLVGDQYLWETCKQFEQLFKADRAVKDPPADRPAATT
jgi:N-6 DNA Methylase